MPGSEHEPASGAPDALPDISEPARHLAADTQDLPATVAAPPAASAADSGADDAAGSKQPPAAAAGLGAVLSSAGRGHTNATAAQATAAAAGCVSLVRRGRPPPTLLLVAGCRPITTLCDVGWVKEVRFCSRCPLQASASPSLWQALFGGALLILKPCRCLPCGRPTTIPFLSCLPTENLCPPVISRAQSRPLQRMRLLWTAQTGCLVHVSCALCQGFSTLNFHVGCCRSTSLTCPSL